MRLGTVINSLNAKTLAFERQAVSKKNFFSVSSLKDLMLCKSCFWDRKKNFFETACLLNLSVLEFIAFITVRRRGLGAV